MGKVYGLNTQVLLANLQHFCNNNIIILNYYYFIPGLFPSHSLWAESCSVRLSKGMVCSRQPQSFQGVDPHGRPDGWTEGGWRDGWQDARIHGRLHFSFQRPLLHVIIIELVYAHPTLGEHYYLQMLLNCVKSATSYEHLWTVDGTEQDKFKDTCIAVWTPCLMHRCVPPRCFIYPLTFGLHPFVESSKIWHGAFRFTEWTILKEWNALWPWKLN